MDCAAAGEPDQGNRLNLPEMVRAARLLYERDAATEFVLPVAPTLTMAQIHVVTGLLTEHAAGLPVRMVRDAGLRSTMRGGSIVASGTGYGGGGADWESLLWWFTGFPPVTYAIAKRVVTVPHVAMVNLVAEKRLVPELIQDDFTAGRIVQELEPLLADGGCAREMMAGLKAVAAKLHGSRMAG